MKRVPLRRRLFLLVAAAIAPLALVSGLALFAFFDEQRAQAHRNALDFNRALATAVEAELRRTISALEVLATAPQLDTDDLASFMGRAQRWLATQPHWQLILLSTPDGTPLMNTRYPVGPLPPLAEKESFDRVLKERKPVVGDLARGARGEWGVPVRVPVERSGRLRFVLTAVITPDAFAELVQRQRVPNTWVISIFDSKDHRLARSRDTQFIGSPPAPGLKAMIATGQPEGTGTTATLEGDPVYTAYTRLADPRWTVASGIPPTVVEWGAWRSLAVYGGGVILSLALGIFVAFRVARSVTQPMARLREEAAGLGRGEAVRPVASDVEEIHAVADSLVAASDARGQHEAEREELLKREQSARAFAEAANKAKDEFLAMLGHELRNPLGAISNAAALLQQPATSEETRVQAREIIVRQAGHLNRLTDDLLDAARALRGKIVLERQPLDLAAFVEQGLRTFRAAGRTRRHSFVEDLDPVWVSADPIRLEQVFSNLLSNAVKFTPAGGTITVIVERERDDAVLRVADTGRGLSPELASRVFDLFVQGDTELDRSLGGLGIGLTLVRRLVEMHGGSVGVLSEGRGKGSEFIVRLPAIEAPVVEAPRRSAPLQSADTPREVLVVEDNDDARLTLRMLLEMAGHRVHEAADGERGYARALELRPQVMLVDIGLPRMDGYEIARRLTALDGERPFMIALTGYGAPEDRDRAIEAGFDAHLVKPVDFNALSELLRRKA